MEVRVSSHLKNDTTPTTIESSSSAAKNLWGEAEGKVNKETDDDCGCEILVHYCFCFKIPHGRLKPWGDVISKHFHANLFV